jgi:hypothetical protein
MERLHCVALGPFSPFGTVCLTRVMTAQDNPLLCAGITLAGIHRTARTCVAAIAKWRPDCHNWATDQRAPKRTCVPSRHSDKLNG